MWQKRLKWLIAWVLWRKCIKCEYNSLKHNQLKKWSKPLKQHSLKRYQNNYQNLFSLLNKQWNHHQTNWTENSVLLWIGNDEINSFKELYQQKEKNADHILWMIYQRVKRLEEVTVTSFNEMSRMMLPLQTPPTVPPTPSSSYFYNQAP